MTIPNNNENIDFFNWGNQIWWFNLSGIAWINAPTPVQQTVNNPVYQDALTSQISEEVQTNPQELPFYKRWNIASDLGYDEDSMIENINESMKSGVIPPTASAYDRRVIQKLQKAVQWWLNPNPEAIMQAIPEIPYNVAYRIAQQQPPRQSIHPLSKALWMITPLGSKVFDEIWKIARDVDYLDPTFDYQTLEQTQNMNLMWVRWDKPNRDTIVEQLSIPQFVFENGARLLWNLPSAIANGAIFAWKLAFDTTKTIWETVQWLAAIPKAVRDDMIKADNIAGKFQRFVDGIFWFVVENPDIVIAPEAFMRWKKVFSAWIPWPLPEWAAPSTIQDIVMDRLKNKWLEPNPENVSKEANTLYNEILENPQARQDYDVPQDIKNESTIYRWENAQWEVVYRPPTQEVIDNLDLQKEIQETFWQTIRWVRTPEDITRKSNDFVRTMELVLDNRDTLPTLFPDWKVSKNISVSDFAEWANITKQDMWQNLIEPAFSALDQMEIVPTTIDMNYISKTVQNSIDGMMVQGKISPVAKKAYNTLNEYLDILTTPWITILDMQRLSQELNAATKQLYWGSSLSPANMFEQTQLAALNIVLRDIVDKHTSKLLWDMKMKDLKRQRWAIRWSIEQITKRGQVLDRQANNSLTDVIGSSFGVSEIMWWLAFGRPEMVVSWAAIKWIQSYIKYLNSPNRKLRNMLNKINDYRDWFKVPWGFSDQWQVAQSMQQKIQEMVSNFEETKAAKQRVADIQDDFAKTIQTELIREPVTSIRIAWVEITPEWVIRQPWVETPRPKPRTSPIEVDTFTPAKRAREEAAKEMSEMQAKENSRLAELMQKTRLNIIDKRMYDFAKENGTLVEWSDVFNGIRSWDVTQFGIVERTTIDGTKYKVMIQWMENPVSPYDLREWVYRIEWDPRDKLIEITNEVDAAISAKPTTQAMKDLVKKFEDEMWETTTMEKNVDLTEPQQEIAMRQMVVEDKPAGTAPDTPIDDFVSEMERTADTSLMNQGTENFDATGFGIARRTAAVEILDSIGVEWASLENLSSKLSELPAPISNEVQRIAKMRNPEKALEAVESLRKNYENIAKNTDVTDDLIKEARKYDSADEFVSNAKWKTLYHWTSRQFDQFDIKKSWEIQKSDRWQWIYFTRDKSWADFYRKEALKRENKELNKAWEELQEIEKNLKPTSDTNSTPLYTEEYREAEKKWRKILEKVKKEADQWWWRVIEVKLSPDAKIYKHETIDWMTDPYLSENAIADWYDAIVVDEWKYMEEWVILNPDVIKTESQLRKIREQANKTKAPTMNAKINDPVVRVEVWEEYKSIIDDVDEKLANWEDIWKELVALHNLNKEKLRSIKELWWSAMPSFAITERSIDREDFWDITLVWDRALIDPKWNKSVNVYTSDMYSPRVPRAEVFIKRDKKTKNRINQIADELWAENWEVEEFIKDPKTNYILEKYPWIEKYTNEIWELTDKKIFKWFTNLWNRRYTNYTLENVIKEMKKQWLVWNESGIFEWSLSQILSKQWKKIKNLDDIRKEVVFGKSDEIDELYNKAKDKYNDIINEISLKDKSPSFRVPSIISDEISSWRKWMKKALKEYDIDVDQKTIDELFDVIEEVSAYPKSYIEAKIARGVWLDEFTAIIVPEDQVKDVQEILEWTSLKDKIVSYNPESTKRSEKLWEINKKFGNIFFQVAWWLVPAWVAYNSMRTEQ